MQGQTVNMVLQEVIAGEDGLEQFVPPVIRNIRAKEIGAVKSSSYRLTTLEEAPLGMRRRSLCGAGRDGPYTAV